MLKWEIDVARKDAVLLVTLKQGVGGPGCCQGHGGCLQAVASTFNCDCTYTTHLCWGMGESHPFPDPLCDPPLPHRPVIVALLWDVGVKRGVTGQDRLRTGSDRDCIRKKGLILEDT